MNSSGIQIPPISSNGRIRIAHLIPSLEVGGAERSLVNLVTRLDRSEFDNLVISMTDRGSLANALEQASVPLITLGMRRGRPSLVGWFRLKTILRQFNPTVLQTWLYHADFLGLTALGGRSQSALCWNIRCSNMDLTHYRPLTRIVVGLLARLSSRPEVVVCNSEAGQRYHTELGYHPRAWAMIPNGFDTERFQPDPPARDALINELNLDADTLIVGAIGRFDPEKDHETFLRAARLVLDIHPKAHFVVVGTGVSRLRERANAHGVATSVHLLECRPDVARIMAGFDVGCLSSAWGEGFPNVLGEMMACGVPCVATDVGDVSRILADTGTVVPPAAPPAMAAAISALLALSGSARRALGSRARARIEQHFTLAETVYRYATLYRDLAGDN